MIDLDITTIKKSICDAYTIQELENNRFLVITPFYFDDGDGYTILLKNIDGNWCIGDEGHSLMELSYHFNLDSFKTTRKEEFEEILDKNNIQIHKGEFIRKIEDESTLGEQILEYINFTTQSYDLIMTTREKVESMFYKDLHDLIYNNIPANMIKKDYYNSNYDPDKFYKADYKISPNNQSTLIFALKNNDKVLRSLLTINQMKSWNEEFSVIGIYENYETVPQRTRKEFSKFSDITYNNLYEDKDEISANLKSLAEA